MTPVIQTILGSSKNRPEGNVLYPKEFLGHNTRAAVDQAFTRLTKAGKLLRVGRGAYVAPVSNRFGNRPPSTEAVIKSIAAKKGEEVAANGAVAANSLGLTTQVPVQEVFITSGRSRMLRLGKRTITFKHAPRWQLALGNRPAGTAIRALAWIGPEHAPEALVKIRKRLSKEEWGAMVAARAFFPEWIAKLLGEAVPFG
jgi:hypothetical protein